MDEWTGKEENILDRDGKLMRIKDCPDFYGHVMMARHVPI